MSDSESKTLHAFVASYRDPQDGKADYGALRELVKTDDVGRVDVAFVEKHENGKLRISKKESITRTGTEIGLLAGLVVGIIIPPVLLVEAAGGAVAGGLVGHFSRGMHRKDAEALGAALDAGQVGIVVVGVDNIDDQVTRVFTRATSLQQASFDVDSRDIDWDSLHDVTPAVAA